MRYLKMVGLTFVYMYVAALVIAADILNYVALWVAGCVDENLKKDVGTRLGMK